MQHSRPRRECRDYERIWRGRCVDRNLEDAWLEALNALAVFDLISICEGHVSEQPNRLRGRPHINLRLKATLLPEVIGAWSSTRKALREITIELFREIEASVTLELKHRIQLGPHEIQDRDDFTVKIQSRQAREGHSIDVGTISWFHYTVSAIEELDRFMSTRLRPSVRKV